MLDREKLLILILLSCLYLFSFTYGETIVELVPNNITAKVGDYINLDLVIKNVPDNIKCEGFETYVYYNSSMLSISKNDVVLKDVSKDTSYETITVSNGKIWISLWLNKDFSGNFTVATLSFKALNEGHGVISLNKTVVSDANGQHIEPLILKDSNVTIKSITINNSNTTFSPPNSCLLLDNLKYNTSLTGKLIINNTITPIKKINGTISLRNIQLLGIEPNNDACKEFTYKKSITRGLYSGLLFYGENNYNKFYLEYGETKNLSLIAYNVDENITYISGCIYINTSRNDSVLKLKFLGNKSIYKIKKEYKNNSLVGCYLYFNASPNKSGNFEIANVKITPNSTLSLKDIYRVHLINVSAYSGDKKINLKKSTFEIDGTSCNPYNEQYSSIFVRSEIFNKDHTTISFGDVKVLSIIYWNNSQPITNISGKIYINSSLLNVLDYNISPELSNNIKYKDIHINGNYLFFNLTFNSPIQKSKILCIRVTPKENMDATTLISINTSQNFISSPLKVEISKKDFSSLPAHYYGTITNVIFSFIPDSSYENSSELSILNLNLKFFEDWKVLMDIYQNGIKTNSSVVIKKSTNNTKKEINNTIQIDAGYSTCRFINTSYGQNPQLLYLRLVNVEYNITNISGNIIVENSSLIKIDDVNIYNKIKENISYKNITYNESNIFFNLSFKHPISGEIPILTFHIEAKVDTTADTTIYLSNLTIYSNTTKINLTVRNMTVHISKRKKNNPPKLFVAFNILNNKEVHFYAFGYDKDNDSLKYFWDFGDGSNSTDKDPVHRYANYSEYAVKCVVKDPLNGTDDVKFVISIKNLSPIIYNLSNPEFYICKNESGNKTVYLNIFLSNPFRYRVLGYIDFENYGDYTIPKPQYEFEMLPNETINLTIPINISKSTTIDWSVKYYVAYPNRLSGKFKCQLLYYEWKFKSDIKFSEIPVVKVYKYIKTIELNNSNILLKINKHKIFKNFVVEKVISVEAIPKKYVVYYSIISLVGFMLGVGLIRKIKP